MKLDTSGPQWILTRGIETAPKRTSAPALLTLDETVAWIRNEKPLLWIGSIFSVPKPSSFPSGYALSHSLARLVIPRDDRVPEHIQDAGIDDLIAKWPLEAILDEFESLYCDISESLLGFFSKVNDNALPNPLHQAAVKYYDEGFSSFPYCVTSNWDTLLEKAFSENGYSVHTYGPAADYRLPPTKDEFTGRKIGVWHPHGSFETHDVVCSYHTQQRQLPITPGWAGHPTLFMGYSGYEPSLYRHLEFPHQLWCIKSEEDLKIPAKRRLLCRPDVFVYVGDLQDVLRTLGLLNEQVDLTTPYLHLEQSIPPKVIDVILCGLAVTLQPEACANLLPEILLPFHDEPEATFRGNRILQALSNHVRNRTPHPSILLGLMAATQFRHSEQVWISTLADILRNARVVPPDIVKHLLKQAAKDFNKQNRAILRSTEEIDNSTKLFRALIHGRTRCYRCYVGKPEGKDKSNDVKEYILSQFAGLSLGDMALAGEMAELAGFAHARDGDFESARGCLDAAATYYYLTGLWNGGRIMEWASNNMDAVKTSADANTLYIEMEETDGV